MEGFGVHTFRLVNAEGRIDLREVPLEAEAGGCSPWSGTRPSRSTAPTPISIAAISGMPSQSATSRSGSSACSSSTRTFAERFDFDVLDPDQADSRRSTVPIRRVGQARARSTVWRTSSPRPSRWRSARRTSFPASTSRTTRCCRGGTSPISIRSSSGSVGPTSRRSRSTRRSARSRTFQQDGHMAHPQPDAAARTTSRTRWSGAERGPRESAEPRLPFLRRAEERGPQAPHPSRRASPTTTARRGSSSSASSPWSSSTSRKRSSSS